MSEIDFNKMDAVKSGRSRQNASGFKAVAEFSYPLTSDPNGPMITLRKHPLAMLFPVMSSEDFHTLVNDILKHGQREPVLVHKGQVLDGWNRVQAVGVLQNKGHKIALRTREYDGPTDEVSLRALVVSTNLARRHLTASQRAAIALELLPQYEAAAKERQRTKSAPKPRQLSAHDVVAKRQVNNPSRTARDEEGEARQQAAKALGVSPRYVSDLKFVRSKKPDLIKHVSAGRLTVPQALNRVKAHKPVKTTPAALLEGLTESTARVIGGLMLLEQSGNYGQLVSQHLRWARKLDGWIRRVSPPTKSNGRKSK
jgi:hypothetical protein